MIHEYDLTEEQSLFIHDLRCNKDFSWRALARDFTEKYPHIESPTSNQIVGRDLCYSAMKKSFPADIRWED